MTPRRYVVVCAAVALLAGPAQMHGQQRVNSTAFTFETVDVFLASDVPLAAWQFELGETQGRMTVVGVERGGSRAYGEAPYYDLAAVDAGEAERIIVADFSEDPTIGLPTGNVRLATIHVRLAGTQTPSYEVRLIAAGDATGRPIDAAIRLQSSSRR